MILAGEKLWFSYHPGTPVLRGVSVQVASGELRFLLGPNGSGKTTLLGCLGGFLPPDRGRVHVGGRDLSQIPLRERARYLAYVPQLHRPTFGYTVLEFVVMGRAAHLGPWGRPGKVDLELARRALAEVRLERLAAVPYTQISGGELRLALIARALAQDAKFLLLDEPDAHLDPGNQQTILRLLRELAGQGLGLVVTSHNPNSALAGADTVTLLREGEALASGPVASVLTPRNLATSYGVEFSLLTGDQGERALVPRWETSAARASGLKPRGWGSW